VTYDKNDILQGTSDNIVVHIIYKLLLNISVQAASLNQPKVFQSCLWAGPLVYYLSGWVLAYFFQVEGSNFTLEQACCLLLNISVQAASLNQPKNPQILNLNKKQAVFFLF
jgi:hypothetical protein